MCAVESGIIIIFSQFLLIQESVLLLIEATHLEHIERPVCWPICKRELKIMQVL